jgi:hypothetical protein
MNTKRMAIYSDGEAGEEGKGDAVRFFGTPHSPSLTTRSSRLGVRSKKNTSDETNPLFHSEST